MEKNAAQQQDWASIGKLVQQIRHNAGLSTLAFAQKLQTSPMNIALLENASSDSAFSEDLYALGEEMRWESLIDRIQQRFYPVQDSIPQYNAKLGCPDHEITILVPLTLSQSNLIDALNLNLDMVSGKKSKENVYKTIDRVLYYTLIDYFLLYQHEMRKICQPTIAAKTATMMAEKMNISAKCRLKHY